jgi:hypothetical protein
VAARPGRTSEQQGEALHPPVHSDVVDLNSAFGEQLLHVAV